MADEETDDQARHHPSLDWYAPNSQAVGVDAVADLVTPYDEPEAEPEATPDVFDPADYSVEDVKVYVTEHPDERARVADAEADGKARSTLLAWLDSSS